MNNLAVAHCDLDSLRDILGIPESVRIIGAQVIPHHVAGPNGSAVRLVMESPEFPPIRDGESIPMVNLQYTSHGENHRRFDGFQPVVLMSPEEVSHGA